MNKNALKHSLRIYFLALLSIAAVIAVIAGISRIAGVLKPDNPILIDAEVEEPPDILEIQVLANFWNPEKTSESPRLVRMTRGERYNVGNPRAAFTGHGLDMAENSDEIYRYWFSELGNDVTFILKSDGELKARFSAASFIKPLVYGKYENGGMKTSGEITTSDDAAGRYEMAVRVCATHNEIEDRGGDEDFNPDTYNRVYTEYFDEAFPEISAADHESENIPLNFRKFRRKVCETAVLAEVFESGDSGKLLAKAVIKLTFHGMWENENGSPVYDTLYELGLVSNPDDSGGTTAKIVGYWQDNEN